MATPTMDIKEDADHLEIQQDPRYDLRYLSREDAEFLSSFPEAAKKKVMWKVKAQTEKASRSWLRSTTD